jgi:hypothetical protein
MAVKNRSNRSGSDPLGSPYRPDSWASMNPSFGASQRYSRESRSMSLDSNTGKTNGLPNGFTASSSNSVMPSTLSGPHNHNTTGGYPGYYGSAYTYNRPVGHTSFTTP